MSQVVGVLEIQLMAGMARLSEDMRRAEKVVGDSMLKVERSAHSAMSALNKIGLGVGLFAAMEQVKQLSDRYTKLDAQLRISTKTQQEYNTALNDVRRISTIAQADIGATTMLYTRLMNTLQGTAVTQKQIATVSETVSYGLKAFGATSAEAASAALQLSQAMGANRLGGEEFRAVMEAMPNVMKVLADSMGVPLGELRALSIAGKITTAEMVKAFGDPAVAESFRKLAMSTQTISGALVVMGNNTMQFVGSLLKTTGATDGAISAIASLGDVFKYLLENVKQVSNLVLALAAAYGGKFVAGVLAARMMTMAHTEALAMNAKVNLEAATAAQFAAKANLAQGAQMALATGNTRYATTARVEHIAATKALAAAEAAHAASTMTWMGKIKAFAAANVAGLIGLALWGAYTFADNMGWIDAIGNKLGDFFNTQESHIRRLKEMAGGGAAGDAMSRAMSTIAEREAAQAARDAQKKALAAIGVTQDVSSPGGAAAAIAKLEGDLTARRSSRFQGEWFKNQEANIVRAIATLKEYQIELGKTTGPNLPVADDRLGAGDQLFVNTKFAEIAKHFNEGKLSVVGFKKEILDMYAALSEKQKKGRAVADPNEWRIAMYERMRAEATATGKTLTNIESVAKAEATAAGKKIRHITAAQLAEVAYLADLRTAQLASDERTKDMVKANDALERSRIDSLSTAQQMIAYDNDLLKKEQDKLRYKIQETDNLELQMQLRKEIDEIERKRTINARQSGFAEIFSSKGQESAQKEMFTGLITGAITDWRDMIKVFGNSFKTKVIDTMAQFGSDMMKKLGENANMWLAVAAAVIAASGMLNRWEQSKKPANITLTGGRGGVGGSVSTLWERDAGWFAQKEQEFRITGLTAKQTASFNATLDSVAFTMGAAGDALGYANAGTQAFTISLTTNGDVTTAMANQIGSQLVPAIVLFQREGENLQATAQRLTDTFKATGDLITALGVSSADAFGGFGLQSAAARESLVSASGGLQAFNTNAQGFINNFLTPAEKLAPAADAVARTFEKLGIVGVSTNAQFAQLVKEQLALGNTDVVAQLLSVSGAFDSLTKAAQTANEQINALLDKKLFSTLVDYLRATKLGSSAGAAIAKASVGLGGTTAAEQAATAAYTSANADAIARAAAEQALTTTEMSNDPSLWQQLLAVIKELLDGLWILLRDAINNIWVAIRDFITSLPQMLIDAILGLVDAIAKAIGDAINGITGGILDDGINVITDPIEDIGSVIGLWAKGGAFGFANGGAFTGGLYNSPTPFTFANGSGFSAGVMGEAGPEAVMPLQRGPDGRLGVAMHGGSGLADEVRALRAEVVGLRADARAERSALVNTAQRTERILDKWDHVGLPEVQLA